jgi:hypothetical protein
LLKYGTQRLRLGDVAVFENCQPVTTAKFKSKSPLFILLLGVIHRLELRSISEQKVENIPACRQAGSSTRHIAKPPVVRSFLHLIASF